MLDRLGKLIPRLSSDHDGEIIATVAAIGRTLKGAKLDFHDLGKRVTAETMAEVIAGFGKSYTGSGFSRPRSDPPPARSEAPPEKPKPEPSPWPTFMQLGRHGRLRWIEAVRSSEHYQSMKARKEFEALYEKMYRRPHEFVTRKEVNFFNKIVRISWLLGIRANEQRPA